MTTWSDQTTTDRILRLIVGALASRDDRDELLADLDAATRQHHANHGVAAARAWQRRQLARSIPPLLRRRLSVLRPAASFGGIGQDCRLAVRSLASAPVFTVSIVLMLGLTIGSHTVIYAVADATLFRPLPFGARSPRLFTLHSIHPTVAQDWDDAEMSYLDFLDFRREATSLERLEGVIDRNVSISTGTETQRVLAASVTPGLFSMLGVAPVIGRDFRDADAAPPGLEPGLIISHSLWHTLTGGDPRIISRTLLLNGRQVPVLGVMPEGFTFPNGHQLWLPYRAEDTIRRDQRSLLAIGLLATGTTLDSATAELRAIATRIAERHPATNRDWSVHTILFRKFFVSASGTVSQLLGGVTLLLLAACANVAGLIVSRGLGRQRELTLRAALGSGRLRLVRLLLIENAALAVLGGVFGLLCAAWGIKALLAWIPEPPPYWATPSLDARVAAFAIALTAAVTMLTGLFPAMRIARVDAAGALLPGARSIAQRFSFRRVQHGLVVGQLALSLMLLVGGVLLGRSATALLRADGGFARESLLSLRFYLAGDRYDQIEARARTVQDVIQRVAAIPGIRGAAVTGAIPTDDGGAAIRIRIPGATATADEMGAQLIPVTSGFWDTLALRISDGRSFTDTESVDPAADVVTINNRLAARLWPGQSAVNRQLQVVGDRGEVVDLRVIGVVPDLVYEEFGESTPQSQLNVYIPIGRSGWRTQALLVNLTADAAQVTDAVRAEFRKLDPGIAVFDVLTMDERRAYNHWADRFVGQTFSTFALAALVLACVGAYAIAAGAVAQRRREIGVRMALGAARRDIRNLFLGNGIRLACLGIGCGVPLAMVAARMLEQNLFRVSPWDRDLWLALPLSLLAAVIVATYLPARLATRVDPAITLRDS